MMPATAPVSVVVVGAGPTGMSAAILLAQRGVDVLIVDRYPEPYPLPRAVHVHDEIRRVFQQMGIEEHFAEITQSSPGMRLLDAEHRTMAEFLRSENIGHHGYPQANMFDQPDLEDIMRSAMTRYPSIRYEPGVEMVTADQDVMGGPAPLRVRLRDVSDDSEQEVWTKALLGCDGANSPTRALIGATMEDLGYEERWLVVDVRSSTPLPMWTGLHQVCDPARAATFLQIGPERYRFEFQLADGESEAALVRPDRLAALLAPWTKDLPVDEVDLIRSAQYTFRARIADRWRDRRVFILGDAAHLTPPFIGQGLCAGVRDAVNLTWKLALVLNGTASEKLLNTYETERVPHARKLIRTAVLVGWAMTGGQDRAAFVRKGVLSVAVRLPGFRSAVIDQMAPPLQTGPLVQRKRRSRRGLAGTFVPQPRVELAGEEGRLDDVLGDSFVLLATGEVDPGLRRLCDTVGAPVLQVVRPAAAGSTPNDRAIIDIDGSLFTWLSRGHSGAVLLRPDRVVLAAARATGRRGLMGSDIVRDAASWLPLLSPDIAGLASTVTTGAGAAS